MGHPRPWITGREGKGTGPNWVPQNSHPTAVTSPCTPLPVQRCPFCKVCSGLSSTDTELASEPGHGLLPYPSSTWDVILLLCKAANCREQGMPLEETRKE